MPAVAPERRESLEVLLRWRPDGGSHLDELVGEFSGRSGKRGFVQHLCYGVVRNLRLLDLWIDYLSADRRRGPDPRTRAALRMGLYEVMRSQTAAHAAVNESVTLAGRAGGFVNAVLRRALRESELLEDLVSSAALGVRYSHPDFLVDRWVRHFGPERTRALCAWDQEPAPIYVRENRLKAGGLGSGAGDCLDLDGFLEGENDFRKVDRLPWEDLELGLVYAQDPSTAMACRLLSPEPGQRLLDACASPGGKTALLAQMMKNRGEIVATDARGSRLERLRGNLDRLGVEIAEVSCVDWGGDEKLSIDEFGTGFDRILVDVPCSNTGVLRRRVDARWRIREGDFARLAQEQFAILSDVARFLRPDGKLVYSTCSIDAEENRGVVDAFIAETEGWCLQREESSVPPDSGFDGAYAAVLVRADGHRSEAE